jgi:hypothetical protein
VAAVARLAGAGWLRRQWQRLRRRASEHVAVSERCWAGLTHSGEAKIARVGRNEKFARAFQLTRMSSMFA